MGDEPVPRQRDRRLMAAMAVMGTLLLVGIGLWMLGMRWGILLAGVGILGFVVLAWISVRPRGGHVHHDLDPWAAGG
jgi:hypothetical protein